VSGLSTEQRRQLLNALQNSEETATAVSHVDSPSSKQLIHVAFIQSLPFVGFGFLDNFIMILAGDYIDLTLGGALGISTMAAAALGNAVSDVAGVGSASYVEMLTAKLGVPQPDLQPRQMELGATRWAVNLGRAFGVALGCIIGMVPLLFLPEESDRCKDN